MCGWAIIGDIGHYTQNRTLWIGLYIGSFNVYSFKGVYIDSTAVLRLFFGQMADNWGYQTCGDIGCIDLEHE